MRRLQHGPRLAPELLVGETGIGLGPLEAFEALGVGPRDIPQEGLHLLSVITTPTADGESAVGDVFRCQPCHWISPVLGCTTSSITSWGIPLNEEEKVFWHSWTTPCNHETNQPPTTDQRAGR